MATSSRPRGLSLLEILIGATLLSLVSLFSIAFLSQSQRLWRRVDSSSTATQSLTKANARLGADLINVGRQGVASMPHGSGPQRMGDALWFLSAWDPASQAFIRNAGGRSFWQKTVLYYLTVPQDHDSLYGVSCQAWDQVCSHKILLRKVIDTGLPTTPSSAPEQEETLPSAAQIAPYLTRPDSLDLTTLQSEPGVVSVEYISGYLLDMVVTLNQQAGQVLEVDCVVRAGLLQDAKGHFQIGRDPFPLSTFTLSRNIRVVPRN